RGRSDLRHPGRCGHRRLHRPRRPRLRLPRARRADRRDRAPWRTRRPLPQRQPRPQSLLAGPGGARADRDRQRRIDRPRNRRHPRPAGRLAGRRVADRHRDQHRADAVLRGRRGAAHPRPDSRKGRLGPATTLASTQPMIGASIFRDFWNNQILADEKQGLFLVLVGFILSFAFIRMSTRLMRSPRVPWWPGSVVSDSGVHLHHLVFGIVTMMIAGTLGLAALGDSPYTEICALFFGVGAGLTIDEFALWVYLDDVYWAEEG